MNLIRTALLLCLALTQSPTWAAETIILHLGQHRVRAEIANTPQIREHGLMQRTHLCPNCGMLFVFTKPDRYHFWMKNTPLPLSIAFIAANGAILNMDEMQPNSTAIHSAQGQALYALEMNSGWFSGMGIKQGDVILGLESAPHGL